MSGQSTDSSQETPPAEAHLTDLEDGCGCAEVWEYLSERREADRREASIQASDEGDSPDGGD